jgi:hypothetical protein
MRLEESEIVIVETIMTAARNAIVEATTKRKKVIIFICNDEDCRILDLWFLQTRIHEIALYKLVNTDFDTGIEKLYGVNLIASSDVPTGELIFYCN